MNTGFDRRAAFAIAALSCAPVTLQAADQALVYNKTYQCGTEIIQVAYCRRDSDLPGFPPTTDAENFCHAYYLDRPKNGLGGTAFGMELRSEIEQRLRGCGALASSRPAGTTAPSPSTAQRTAESEMARGQKLFEAKDFKGAITAFQAAIPLTPDAAIAARAFRGIGASYRELGNYDQALTALRESLRLNPKDAAAHSLLGNIQRSRKDYRSAMTAFQDAVRLAPGVAANRFNLAVTQVDAGQHENALANFREYLRLSPKDAEAWNLLGVTLTNVYEDEDALAAFQEAARLEPKSGVYQFNLGSTLAAIGRRPEAIKVLAVLEPLDAARARDLRAELQRTRPPKPGGGN